MTPIRVSSSAICMLAKGCATLSSILNPAAFKRSRLDVAGSSCEWMRTDCPGKIATTSPLSLAGGTLRPCEITFEPSRRPQSPGASSWLGMMIISRVVTSYSGTLYSDRSFGSLMRGRKFSDPHPRYVRLAPPLSSVSNSKTTTREAFLKPTCASTHNFAG